MTYEYHCKFCGHEFETVQSIKDNPLEKCPRCNSNTLQRLISVSTFVLKGEGWAADNYSKKN